MGSVKEKYCSLCERALAKDEIGLNKKILEFDTQRNVYRCLICMAEFLECTTEELQEKIEEFKIEGCKLFS